VVIVASIVSLSVLAVAIVLVVTQVKHLVAGLSRVQQELDPHLAKLSTAAEETQRRLEQVSEAGRALSDGGANTSARD
jgi:hypothetical protein